MLSQAVVTAGVKAAINTPVLNIGWVAYMNVGAGITSVAARIEGLFGSQWLPLFVFPSATAGDTEVISNAGVSGANTTDFDDGDTANQSAISNSLRVNVTGVVGTGSVEVGLISL